MAAPASASVTVRNLTFWGANDPRRKPRREGDDADGGVQRRHLHDRRHLAGPEPLRSHPGHHGLVVPGPAGRVAFVLRPRYELHYDPHHVDEPTQHVQLQSYGT